MTSSSVYYNPELERERISNESFRQYYKRQQDKKEKEMIPQIVQVVFGRVRWDKGWRGGHSHTYSYRWLGARRLHVRDRVVVPENWAHGHEQLATVVALGRGDYDGSLSNLVGVVDLPKLGEAREPSDADLPIVAIEGAGAIATPLEQYMQNEIVTLNKKVKVLTERINNIANNVRFLEAEED